MNVVPRILRRSSKLAKKCNNIIIIKRSMIHYQRQTFRSSQRGFYNRSTRSFSSKAPQPLKAGFGLNALGAYFAYLAIIYGVQYVREKSRPYNALSTGDDVMKGIDLSGKSIIVTGCNAGLGKETVRCLVGSGATVIMACRNLKKANKARDDIIATFDESKQSEISKRLVIMQLDLGSLQSVYDFSKAFVESGLKLDYLVNNAGIMMLPDYVTTADDIERQWGVNHLGHFYLSKLLLDPVLIPNKTRVVTLSSFGHKFCGSYDNFDKALTKGLEEGDFMGSQKGDYTPLYGYGLSKASNILFARELNTRYKDKGIVSVSLHPGGITETELARDVKIRWDNVVETLTFLPMYLFTPFYITEWKTMKQGVATTLRCVTISDEDIVGGEFYYNCIPSSVEGRKFDGVKQKDDDDILAKKLWILSETIIANKGFKLEL